MTTLNRPIGIRLPMLAVAVMLGLTASACGNGLQLAEPAAGGSVVVHPGKPSSSPDADAGGDSKGDQASDQPMESGGSGDHGKGDQGKGDQGNGDQGKGDQEKGDEGKGDQGKAPDHDSGNDPDGADGSPELQLKNCGVDDLAIDVKVPEGGGAAGSTYAVITFTNTSDKSCIMKGYAGVSFVGHQDGTQLGQPATRDNNGGVHEVGVAPGTNVTELLRIANAGNWDAAECAPTTADGFRIYPPDSYDAAYVPFEHQACQHEGITQLTVYPVGGRY